MMLSIVFSFRNEEGNIRELVSRVSSVVASITGLSYEMIFVNDRSTDGSLQLLTELQDEYPITIINMSRRFGVVPCVFAGMENSLGDAVVYMDSDLQDPPEIISELVEKFINGADVVHTTRTQREGESAFKLWVTSKAYSIISNLSDIDLPDNTGDFKLLSRRAVDHILDLKEYDPYMRGLSVWVGFDQDYVMYRREPRHSGKTKFPLFSKGPANEFVRGITAYSAAPLYASFFLGLAATLVSVFLVIYALYAKITGASAPGASGIIIVTAFFGGAILLSNGLLGIYISKIFYETKGRPKYIIESVIRSSNEKE